jgi:hypothetical protein
MITKPWPKHFRAKWMPVRVKKMRQDKNLELGSDSIGTEKALEVARRRLKSTEETADASQ